MNNKINAAHDFFYRKLYLSWRWFGMKVLRVPYCFEYRQPGRTMGIIFSWSLEYSQRVQNIFVLTDERNQLAELVRKQNAQIFELNEKLAKKRKRR